MKVDLTTYTPYTPSNFVNRHWVYNPGLAFNELVLGQRIPKKYWVQQKHKWGNFLDTYIPCPHCHTLHEGKTWAKGKAFGNWFGLCCPNCFEVIPCLRNKMSALVLLLMYPILILFKKKAVEKWKAFQQYRFKS